MATDERRTTNDETRHAQSQEPRTENQEPRTENQGLHSDAVTQRPAAQTLKRSNAQTLKRSGAPALGRSNARARLPAEELLARYAAGERVAALALRYGCAELTVRTHLRRLGALPPAQPQRHVEITRAALEELYAQRRWPIIRIAAHFGVSPVTVDSRRRAFGIPARRGPRKS